MYLILFLLMQVNKPDKLILIDGSKQKIIHKIEYEYALLLDTNYVIVVNDEVFNSGFEE